MSADASLTPALRAAAAIVEELAHAGVAHVCVAPGARSGPLAVAATQHPGLREWMVVDERSAGFFALGMARELGRPVALVCTSGTAAANFLPAVVEAALSEIPLVVLTADRPPELRECAAPQTIDQVRLYGSHVRCAVDLPVPGADVDLDAYYRTTTCRAVATAMAAPAGPVHLNVPFREPLLPSGAAPVLEWSERTAAAVTAPAAVSSVAPAAVLEVAQRLRAATEGLIVCGPRAALGNAGPDVGALAARLGWPVLADPLSGLRFTEVPQALCVDTYDVLLRDPEFRGVHRPRAVLQIGAPPVSKALSTHLADCRPPTHVVLATPGTWPDPTHAATIMMRADAPATVRALGAALGDATLAATPWLDAWRDAAGHARAELDARLADEATLFEGKIAAEVAARLPAEAVLHVGNSMPVRDVDAFARARADGLRVDGNRGANGIDGVLSSALGAAAVRTGPTALLVGDLSFLHDLGGLQIAARHALNAVVVVVNNDGGGVFSFLPFADDGPVFERVFATPHGLDLAAAVALGRGRHHRIDDWEGFRTTFDRALGWAGLDVIEVPSDRAANVRRHRDYIEAVHARLRAVRRSAA